MEIAFLSANVRLFFNIGCFNVASGQPEIDWLDLQDINSNYDVV